jgi:hypothetical protein
MMGTDLSGSLHLEMLSCGECGIEFAVPSAWLDVRKRGTEKSRGFTCPNGHTRIFRETEVERLKRELAAKDKELEQERALTKAAASRAHGAEVQAGRARAQAKRLKQRAAGALCPVPGCCRSFVQLRRHLATKHPDYREVEVGP